MRESELTNEEVLTYIDEMRTAVEASVQVITEEANKLWGFDDEAHDRLLKVAELLQQVRERM